MQENIYINHKKIPNCPLKVGQGKKKFVINHCFFNVANFYLFIFIWTWGL